MLLEIIYIILNIFIVLWAADKLTDGAVKVARRLHMPEIIIGMTVVAFGTSMPELFVSVASALEGSSDMAIGNVVGSNVFNVLLIIGVCAMIAPMSVLRATVRRDLPFAVFACLMLGVLLWDFSAGRMGSISTYEGIVMLVLFFAYIIYTIRKSMQSQTLSEEILEDTREDEKSRFRSTMSSPLLTIPIGLAGLVIGSDGFVNHATILAQTLGVSEAIIGLTIMGFGTSLPEFATSVVAAAKGSTSMAMGNVMGSCIFNILLILGITSVVMPLAPEGVGIVDLSVMSAGALLLWLFSYTKYTMERWEGAIMVLIFLTYMAWLVMGNV